MGSGRERELGGRRKREGWPASGEGLLADNEGARGDECAELTKDLRGRESSFVSVTLCMGNSCLWPSARRLVGAESVLAQGVPHKGLADS